MPGSHFWPPCDSSCWYGTLRGCLLPRPPGRMWGQVPSWFGISSLSQLLSHYSLLPFQTPFQGHFIQLHRSYSLQLKWTHSHVRPLGVVQSKACLEAHTDTVPSPSPALEGTSSLLWERNEHFILSWILLNLWLKMHISRFWVLSFGHLGVCIHFFFQQSPVLAIEKIAFR